MTVPDGDLLSFSQLHASLCRTKIEKVCSADRRGISRFELSRGKVVGGENFSAYVAVSNIFFFSVLSIRCLSDRKGFLSNLLCRIAVYMFGFRLHQVILKNAGRWGIILFKFCKSRSSEVYGIEKIERVKSNLLPLRCNTCIIFKFVMKCS